MTQKKIQLIGMEKQLLRVLNKYNKVPQDPTELFYLLGKEKVPITDKSSIARTLSRLIDQQLAEIKEGGSEIFYCPTIKGRAIGKQITPQSFDTQEKLETTKYIPPENFCFFSYHLPLFNELNNALKIYGKRYEPIKKEEELDGIIQDLSKRVNELRHEESELKGKVEKLRERRDGLIEECKKEAEVEARKELLEEKERILGEIEELVKERDTLSTEISNLERKLKERYCSLLLNPKWCIEVLRDILRALGSISKIPWELNMLLPEEAKVCKERNK